MSSLRHIAIALAVLGTAATAAAQTTTTTTTTTTVERTTGPLKLTPQQRTTVYRTVTRERRVTPPAPVVEEVTVGRRVPSTVVLSPFPESLYVETPALQRYKYFYVNNRLVLVDPLTSEVVEVLDQ